MTRLAPRWCKHLAPSFENWAREQVATGAGVKTKSENIPAAEWSMFGSMFFLATAADLHAAGLIDAPDISPAAASRCFAKFEEGC